MIKSNKGLVSVIGKENEILADFSVIVASLYQKAKIKKEDLEEAFQDGFKEEKEDKDELINVLKAIVKEMEGKTDDGNKDE